MKAMITAAGLGKRLLPLTQTTPKPLVEIGDDYLIGHHLHQLKHYGFEEVVINVSHLADKIKYALGNGSRYGLQIQYSQEATPLEVAGGIIKALPLLGNEPFIVINSDIICDYDLSKLRQIINVQAGHMVMVPQACHCPHADYALANNIVTPANPTYTYSGIGLFNPEIFQGFSLGPRALTSVLSPHISAGKVSGELHQGLWHDLGDPDRLAFARENFAEFQQHLAYLQEA